MEIKIISNPISKEELINIAKSQFGSLVKVVVDIKKNIMAIGGELHSDEEVFLMEREGSKRKYTWGINIYPEKSDSEWIEFDSVINLKPSFGNYSREVESQETKEKIKKIVQKLVV
jgi:hypothetical protein